MAMSRMASALVFALSASSGVATKAAEHLDTVSLLQSDSSKKVMDIWPQSLEEKIEYNKNEEDVEFIKNKGITNIDAIQRIELSVPGDVEPEKILNGDKPCPQENLEPEKDFDIGEYTRASWFVQAQQEVSYQKLRTFRCVVATYTDPIVKEDSPTQLNVYNYRLGGPRTVEKGKYTKGNQILCAWSDGVYSAGLEVAPCLLKQFAGPYWVLKVGKKEDGTYAWAIVSGGKPTVKEIVPIAGKNRNDEFPYNFTGKCTTQYGPSAPQSGSGLWIFSRTPELEPEMLKEAKDWLLSNGFTTRFLYPVMQGKKWCGDYPGAYLKYDYPGMNQDLLYDKEHEKYRKELR